VSREVATTAAVVAASIVFCTAFALAGWPGAPNTCVVQGDCYCEARRLGPVAQPANTWSLLGFVLAGLWIARRSHRDRSQTPPPFLRDRLYPTIYASSVAFMGPGAAFFHASLTDWGGALDVLSMLFWVCFLLYYNLRSLYRWSDRRFLVVYLVTVAFAALSRVFWPSAGLLAFAALHTGWIGTELLVGARLGRFGIRRELKRQRRYFWGYVGINLLALAIWSQGHAGGLLCQPSSILQGHALWHVLNAIAAALLYPYLRSEEVVRERVV
jgi:hypothetical protein